MIFKNKINNQPIKNKIMFNELTKEKLGSRETTRANSQAGEQVVNIEISKIVVRGGFNVRQDFGDIEGLAMSILNNGQTVPARVDVLSDGTFMLVDGNRRYLALKWLLDNGHDEPKLKAIVNLKTTTEEERIIQMFTTQDNKQLLGFETAVLIKRLVNLGYNQTEVADKIGKTPSYISQMLSFEGESPIVKQQVKDGKISVGTVLALQKKMPSQADRVDAVNKAVDNSKTGKRLTINEIGGKAIKAIDLFKNALNKLKEKGENGVMYITAIDDVINLITKYKL